MNDKRLGVMVVDDDQSVRELLETILKEKCTVMTAATGEAALQTLEKAEVNVVLLDLRLPDRDGMDILKIIKETHPDIEVVIISAVKDIEMVVRAMKLGAYHYITKDFNGQEVLALIEKLKEKIDVKRERDYLRGELEQLSDPDLIIGRSTVMHQIEEMIRKIATLPTTVLLLGETGTGK